MVGKIAEPLLGRSKFPWKWVWFLAIATLLAAFAARIGLGVSRYLGNLNDTDRFIEEVERLGGRAGVMEGAFDFTSGVSYIDVDFGHSTITDESFERLVSMPAFRHARFIDLSDTQIGDRSIELIAEKAIIVSLNLSRTTVTDRSLEALWKVSSLCMLRISGTKVTDAGLESLRRRRSPAAGMMLDVTDTKVSEDAVRSLCAGHHRWTIEYGSSESPKIAR